MTRGPRRQQKKIAERQAALRKELFGDVDPTRTWHRKRHDGWTTMPRTMPLLGAIMDGLAGKGNPVSTTYLELWCRSNDDGFVTLSKPVEMAFASGFTGQRGVSTWKERLRKLEALSFIVTKPGVTGPMHYVQIWNPYITIKDHKAKKSAGFAEKIYIALFDRVLEINADDLDD